MTDEKLAELIERYGESVNGLTSSGLRENIFINKQAIIDYHNKKIQEATKYIREIYEKYKKEFEDASGVITISWNSDLWQAIKKTVEGE